MKRITHILFYCGVNLFRFIPFWVVTLLSYLLYVVIYYVVGYRKGVVLTNLQNAFPEKSAEELHTIRKRFYKYNLSAIFLEGIKGFTMSEKMLRKRFVVKNPALLNAYFESGKDIIALASHYANWEWGVMAVDMQVCYQTAALYKPLSNHYSERYAAKLREKHGMELVSIAETRAYFEKKKPKPVAYIMASDQRESRVDKALWIKFLNQDTACLLGAEKYAKYHNLPVLFFDIQRVKRGYYTLEIKELCKEPLTTKSGEITTKYMHMLENIIIQKPEDWLWTHKRWRDKPPIS